MSSQPDEKPSAVPDALVKELLRREGLPLDAHVKVNVHTTRVRLNPDGTRTTLSESSAVAPRSRRPPSKWGGLLFAVIGFAQMAYGMWAGHSDAVAAPLLRGSEACQLGGLVSRASEVPSTNGPAACRLEQAVVVKRYISSSRNVTHYHIVTVTPTGERDDVPVVGRVGVQLWNRVQPTERITLQRFVLPGYHLTGDVVAVGDSAGAAMSRSHPDSGTRYNLVNVLIGGALFVTGMIVFAKARAAEGT
jgi:hypothetical protein